MMIKIQKLNLGEEQEETDDESNEIFEDDLSDDIDDDLLDNDILDEDIIDEEFIDDDDDGKTGYEAEDEGFYDDDSI